MRKLMLLCAMSLWGCGGPAKIEVAPARPLLASKSDSVQLQATVKDQQGKTLSDTKVTFKSMTPTIATVDAAGNVSPVTSGRGTILVKAGEISKEVQVLVQIPKRIEIETTATGHLSGEMLMLGVTRGYKATVYDDRDQPMIAGEVRWATSDPEIFTVDAGGNVKSLKEGEATLTAFAAGIKGSTQVVVKHEAQSEDGTLSQ